MVFENPLITLGIPRAVLVHELASNNLADILKLADANYKTFVKQYHPDRPSGDEDLMTAFGRAIEALQDPKVLEFYVKELVGQQDVDALRLRGRSQLLVERDTRALSHLASGMEHIDQFRSLGITVPTSFIAALAGQRVVVHVTSSSSAFARITNLETGSVNVDGYPGVKLEYHNRVWREAHLDHEYREQWTEYTEFGPHIAPIKLVGFIGYVQGRGKASDGDAATNLMLDSPHKQFNLDWIVPEDCWFLPDLAFARDRPESIEGLVLYREGRFAVTNGLLGTAAI